MGRKKISNSQAVRLAKILGLNLKVYPLKLWKFGIEIELEHGKIGGKLTNVTNDNLLKTSQIALAHILEFPDYYQRLLIMEHAAKKYWKNRKRPKLLV